MNWLCPDQEPIYIVQQYVLHLIQKPAVLEHLTLEMLAYGRQKPAYSHFVARIFRKILAEHLTHFIRKLL